MAYSAAALASPRTDATALAHLTFRPDIEGLRGISVAAVVLFHAFPALLPGGFIGVDVFFVISGFLITRILLDEHRATGRVDLLEFWCRRIRRILPAATLALVLTALLVWLTPALDVREIGRSVTAAALFFLNWRQSKKAVDYLAADEGDNPVMHYWSLAVEEQFYLVWPILLAALLTFLYRRDTAGRAFIWATLAVLAVAAISLSYCAFLTHADRSLAFFSTFSRAWQLLLGALVAVLSIRQSYSSWPSWSAGALSVASLVVLAASFRWIDPSRPYPGLMAFAPTAGAALLIHASTRRLAWGSCFLAMPPLRGLGRVSFSLYLLHWPLIVVAHAQFGNIPWVNIAAIGTALVLSVAAFVLVERPVRSARTLTASKPKTLALGALLVMTGALTGFALSAFGPDDVVVAPGVFASAEAIARDRPSIYDDRCLVRQDDTDVPECIYGVRRAARTVVLFGDSHAANWFPALEKAATEEGWRLLVHTKAACHPIDAAVKRADGSAYPGCTAWRLAAIEKIRIAQPDMIFLASSSNAHPERAERRVIETLASIAPTIVMRDTPRLPEPPVACLKRERDPRPCHWRIEKLQGRKYPKTSEANLPRNARILDLNGRLCPEDLCRAVKDGWGLMTDTRHLTARTARSFSDVFASELRRSADTAPSSAPAP